MTPSIDFRPSLLKNCTDYYVRLLGRERIKQLVSFMCDTFRLCDLYRTKKLLLRQSNKKMRGFSCFLEKKDSGFDTLTRAARQSK